MLLASLSIAAQSAKPKSYIVSKNDFYTIEVKDNQPSIKLISQEKKWVGDANDLNVTTNRINYNASFEEITDTQAYSVSPKGKKEFVKHFVTEDVQIENIFYHDFKYKSFMFPNLEEGSETYTQFKKQYSKPQFLDPFYFKDNLDCKDAKLALKVSKDIEIGYVLLGDSDGKVSFISTTEDGYTFYRWELENSEKEENFKEAPTACYYSPHVIFYIKNYKTEKGTEAVVGSIPDLYRFYSQTVKDINKTDETALKSQTDEIINGLTSDADKTKAIFDYVQSKIRYVAFEFGMGGFIPREASEVLQKKYGDCKDMANLLNEMLTHAKIESYTAWIGTRHNNYTYENVPTPIADNHMIAVAKINNEYVFLDATGQFTIYPNFTPFIQGKQALLKVDPEHYKILTVPVIASEANNTAGKIQFSIAGNELVGKADFALKGFPKTEFIARHNYTLQKEAMVKEYLSAFIRNIRTSEIEITNENLSPEPLQIKYNFALEKWIRHTDNQLLFRPILFFPFADERIDSEKRKVPYEFDFKKSFTFEYELIIPDGYKLDFKPENFTFTNPYMHAQIDYAVDGNKLTVKQQLSAETLLLEKNDFEGWNTAIKTISKQYNQNIIFTRI